MTAIWITARAEWRQRWRSFLLLALLAGLAGGVTLAAFTGSRRADTSFDRLLEREKYPNVSVELDEPPDPELVVGVVDDWSFPWLTVVIAATAALAVAVLLAIPPGRAAARMAPGRVLRSE